MLFIDVVAVYFEDYEKYLSAPQAKVLVRIWYISNHSALNGHNMNWIYEVDVQDY
jgi:hypothetical protein